MYNIHIEQVNNGYIVTVNKHNKISPAVGGSFEDMMYDVGKKMQKGMDSDSVLESIKEGNEVYHILGTHVFLEYKEAIGFLSLLK